MFSATCVYQLVQSTNMTSLKTWWRGRQGSRLDRITGCISMCECCIRPSVFWSSLERSPPCASLVSRPACKECCLVSESSDEGNCWASDCEDESAVQAAAAAGEAVLEAELAGSIRREYDFSNCVRLSTTSCRGDHNSPDALNKNGSCPCHCRTECCSQTANAREENSISRTK